MPLVTTKEMFQKAYNGGYAVGAFNVNNMEIVQGITEAAAELNAPLILQVSKGARAYANHTYLMKLVEAAVIETGLRLRVFRRRLFQVRRAFRGTNEIEKAAASADRTRFHHAKHGRHRPRSHRHG